MSDGFQVTYLPTDPVIQYLPALDDDQTAGWNTTFSQWLTEANFGPIGAQRGVGDARRITETVGSSFEFEFYGTEVWVYGLAHGVAWQADLDGQIYQNTFFGYKDGHYLDMHDLAQGWHTLKIVATSRGGSSGSLHIDKAVFNTGFSGLTAQGSVLPTDKDTWRASGGWEQGTIGDQDDINKRINVVTTTSQGAGLSFVKQDSPVRTAPLLFFYGNLHSEHGKYDVMYSGPDLTKTTSTTLNGASKYVVQHALIWFGVNFPGQPMGSLILSNDEARSLDFMSLDYQTSPSLSGTTGSSGTGTASSGSTPSSGLNSPSSTSSSSKSNIGAIIGGVVGGLAVIVFAVIAVVFLKRRRKQELDEVRAFTVHSTPGPSSTVVSPSMRGGDIPVIGGVPNGAVGGKRGMFTASSNDHSHSQLQDHYGSFSGPGSSSGPASSSGGAATSTGRPRKGVNIISAPEEGTGVIQPGQIPLHAPPVYTP